MARHTLWSEDEVIERFTDDFTKALDGLDKAEAATRAAFDDLERISAP